MLNIEQIFPRRENGRVVHRRWTVDLEAAQAVNKLRGRLQREVTDMAEHFPRWLLTIAAERDLVHCTHCSGMMVFDRGLRCVQCDRARSLKRLAKATRLAWFGLMPPIGIDGLKKIKKKLVARPPKQHVVGHRADIGHFLLVPLVAFYPPTFPKTHVRVAYRAGFFDIPGIPKREVAHEYHMLEKGEMCLFATGQWREEMTCREVLQQRAYPHVIKLLNYGNGKRRAFAIVS